MLTWYITRVLLPYAGTPPETIQPVTSLYMSWFLNSGLYSRTSYNLSAKTKAIHFCLITTHVVAQLFCLSCLSTIVFIYIRCCDQRLKEFFLPKGHLKLVGKRSDTVSEGLICSFGPTCFYVTFCVLLDKASKGKVSTFAITFKNCFPTLVCQYQQN